jgi:fibronectin type 3 domain-containing protein
MKRLISSAILTMAILLLIVPLRSQTGHGITVSWTETNNSDPATGFNVYRGTTTGGESSTALNTAPLAATATSYFDSTVTGGTTYFYTIKALDSFGVLSAPSNEASATAVATSPNPPAGVKAVAQ